jgi:hypothetical protein
MYFVPLKHIIVCILYPKLQTGRRCLLRYLMQKEALCISYPQFIGAETLKKEGLTYIIVCILYPKLQTGRHCLLRYLMQMQKEALCISYPQKKRFM